MQAYFYALADLITAQLRGRELLTCWFRGEDSDFVRFNRSAVRQPGTVTQRLLRLDLIDGRRHTAGELALSGDLPTDRQRLTALVYELRDRLPALPEDPYLLYATEVQSSEQHGDNRLPEPELAVDAILEAGAGRDLVGIYAAGSVYAGFANAFGQRNWFARSSFNVDWSFYHQADKAVKMAYAGFAWEPEAFARKVDQAAAQLEVLRRPPRTVPPGQYRVYLAPAALYDVLDLFGWGGFGLQEHRTKRTPLLKMVAESVRLHPQVTLCENTRDGAAPNFQEAGFLKPDRVVLIEAGAYRDCLVSPRSAREYGVPTNGASSAEAPESLDLAAGSIPAAAAVRELDTGIYINNVWYLNYSDRAAGRITGMTRFATFWVEGGVIQAPLAVMRFDDTIYRMLGEQLVGLTAERDFMLDPGTYHRRSTASGRFPGALIGACRFTL